MSVVVVPATEQVPEPYPTSFEIDRFNANNVVEMSITPQLATPVLLHDLLIFFRVCANLALWPVTPGSFAAAASFFAGMVLPAGIPRLSLSAPGLWMAPLIHALCAMTTSLSSSVPWVP